MKIIKSLEFGVLSPELIRKMSVINITNAETYDKDGFPMPGGLMDPHLGVTNPGIKCRTCGHGMRECTGHFGSLELVRPVIHTEFSTKIFELLYITCEKCGRLMLTNEEREKLGKKAKTGKTIFKEVKEYSEKRKICPHCKAKKEDLEFSRPYFYFRNKIRIYPHEIRTWLEKIPNEDLEFLGYKTDRLRPEWFVLTVLPIPPVTIRPSVTLESGMLSIDDLTHKLVEIVTTNLRLREHINAGAPQLIIESHWDLLQYHITTYLNNETSGIPAAVHKGGRPLKTLAQRLKGKKGLFRLNLIGKRVNFSARTTISPDNFIGINEIGVPQEIADNLTMFERVTKWNRENIKKKIREGVVLFVTRPNGTKKRISEENKEEIIEEIEEGYTIERKLEDGDIVLFNRHPSLHRMNIMAHRVKIFPTKTFRMNTLVCKAYNADFDGDDMNIHIPRTEEGKAEALELMLVENHIVSPRYGAPIIAFDEDGLTGLFYLTLPGTKLTMSQATELLYEAGIKERPKANKKGFVSGREIFSMLLPRDFNIEFESQLTESLKKINMNRGRYKEEAYVVIRNGKLVTGVIDENAVGEKKGILTLAFVEKYGKEFTREFYNKAIKIAMKVLTWSGLTIAMGEYKISESLKQVVEKAIKEELRKGEKIVREYREGKMETLPGRDYEQSFEIKMTGLGSDIKDKIVDEIKRNRIRKIFFDKRVLDSGLVVFSGGKGNPADIASMEAFWGQVNVRELRPARGYKERILPVFERNDVGALARGFIPKSLFTGLKPVELFFFSMGAREGMVDTAVKTKDSGYLYRRLSNALKDIFVAEDLSARSAAAEIIQFSYGEDKVFPMYSHAGKQVNLKLVMEEFGKK